MAWINLTTVFNRIKWQTPQTSKLVVFDDQGSDTLKLTVLKSVPHTVLHARGEVLYAGFSVLWRLLLNIKYLDWRYLKSEPRGIMGALPGELYKIYLLSCIQAMQPRAVLTYIDNSWHFQWISRHYPKAAFYAIQNGVRSELNLVKELPKPPHPGSKVTLQHFFCFGENERDLYQRCGHQVEHYYPVGSLRGAWYKSELATQPDYKYDICLVSQWFEGIMLGDAYPDIKLSLSILDDFLSRYLQERPNLKFAVARRTSSEAEVEYFRNIYGDRAELITHNRETLSSYAAMDNSKLIIAFDSTAAVEAYGWGKKALLCNFSGDPINDSSPVHEICRENDASYEKFKCKLDYLFTLDQNEYLEMTNNNRIYLMNYSISHPCHLLIKEQLLNALSH